MTFLLRFTNAHVVLFVKEAYKHGKTIAASGEGELLINRAALSQRARRKESFRGRVFLLERWLMLLFQSALPKLSHNIDLRNAWIWPLCGAPHNGHWTKPLTRYW